MENKLQARTEPGVTFTVTAPLLSAGINTGLGYLSQKPREPKRKNQRAIETAIPSYAEPQDNTVFLHFIVVGCSQQHSRVGTGGQDPRDQWKEPSQRTLQDIEQWGL